MYYFAKKQTRRTTFVFSAARRGLTLLLLLAVMLSALYALPAQAASSDPVVSLSFDNAVTDSANKGARFTVYDSTSKANTLNGATDVDYGPTNDSLSSFGSSGTDTYWAWHSSSAYGGGLTLDVPATTISNKTYTLGLRFSLGDVTNYKKVIDFKNRTADNGFYIYNSQVNFFTTKSEGNQGTFNAETAYTFLIVRDDTAKTFKVFLDNEPATPIFTLNNIDDSIAVPDSVTTDSVSYYRFGFFHDDLAYLDGASPSGKVYAIKMWDYALSNTQINAQLDKTPPSAPTVAAIHTTSKAISGTAEADATVTVTFPDSSTATTTAGADGIWSLTLTSAQKATLSAGSTVSAAAIDTAGNTSSTTSVIVDTLSLSATAVPLENYINLSWTARDTAQTYHYMVTKKDADVAGSIAQTIPLKPTSKVLNVYPGGGEAITGVTDVNNKTVDTSANVKVWMEANGVNGYGKGLISVDCVNILDFNTNTDSYLKDESGAYKYDVVFVGAWDSNNIKDLSETSNAALTSFINAGGGYLAGHDSGYTGYFTYMPGLLNKNLNMTCDGSVGSVGNITVNVVKKGLLTNYPWTLSGKTLTVPYSHTSTQFAMGDVWMKYSTTEGTPIGTEISSWNGKSGTNNFYLTTWNNVAMIQTGHSDGDATEDEQKVLANTLLYLSQISTSTSFSDHSSQDIAAPGNVSGVTSSVSYDSKATITFDPSTDVGNTYEYQLKAIGDTDKKTYTSDTTTANITSGIKGYAIAVDKLPNTDPGDSVTTTTCSYTASGLSTGTWYAHIKAIDNAGNVSGVVSYAFPVVCKPYVSDVNANSTNVSVKKGNTLTASYTYNANNAGAESKSTFAWLRYDKKSGGTGTVVGTDITYDLTSADVGKYLSFSVTPSNGTLSGTAVESDRIGAVKTLVISSGSSSRRSTNSSITFATADPVTTLNQHRKYISGYPDGMFRPQNNMTRAEFAQALFNLMADVTIDYTSGSLMQFDDVDNSAWYANAVAYLVSVGAIEGLQDGVFGPEQNITRAEAVAIMLRIARPEYAAYSGNFSDISGNWAEEYIKTAYAKGWISGYADGTFKPEQYITRAETVVFINAEQNRKVLVEDIPSTVRTFPDISTTDWYYSDVIEASNIHSFTRDSVTDSEKWSY